MTEQACMQGVLSHYLDDYKQQHRLSPAQGKVCHRISACRTDVLGGQWVKCAHCEFEQYRYHSCRNRHCPKCQHRASQHWSKKQIQRVLPVNYFHVVFTLPHEFNPFVQCHPEVLYSSLFESVWKTIKTFGQDPKRLDGQMGMTAVLHTWGQTVSQHVHLHCLIPGGALSYDQTQWHSAKSNYLFPVKALSRYFRGAMVASLCRAYRRGELHRLSKSSFDDCLTSVMKKEWIVYSKAYLKKAETIVRYLSRYTHKIAISDSRIKRIQESQVTFTYKDSRDNKRKIMSLEGTEFIRRFLLHVLPEGLMRIRHYGFLSNRTRKQTHQTIKACLHIPLPPIQDEQTAAIETLQLVVTHLTPCPKCQTGFLQVCFEIPPKPGIWRR